MKRNFTIHFNPQINNDLQDIVDYYFKESKSNKLGKRFIKIIKTQFSLLKNSALHYHIRYDDDVRCLPISVFPFMIHYRVNEENNSVYVEAVIHTSKNPSEWGVK